MWFAKPILFLLLLASPTTALAAQETGPPGAMDEPQENPEEATGEVEITDAELNAALLAEAAEFEALEGQYMNALAGYLFEVRELRHAGAKVSEYPPRPVHEYFPVFSTMADEGNGPAAFWLIKNAKQLVPDSEQRAEFYRDYFTLLATEHATGQYIKECFDHLLTLKLLLGEEFVFSTLRTVQERSRRPSSVAKALYCEAQVLVSRDGALDPERREQAAELYRILVDGYPNTESAKMAGTPLLKALLEDMRAAQTKWLIAARAKLDAGEDPSTWGLFPYAEFRPLIEAIAGAQHPIAQMWTDRIFPAMDQAAREGVGGVIGVETGWLSRRFGNGNLLWMEHKFALLDFMYRAFPNEPFVFASLEELQKNVFLTDHLLYVDVLDTLLAHTTNDRIRGEAQYILAQALTESRTLVELERAERMFEAAATTAPIERQRMEAADMGLDFKWSMPGMVHPTLNLIDSDQAPLSTLAYRGKILVLYFWTMDIPESARDLDFPRELQSRYASDPFALLGLNCEMMDLRTYAKMASKHNITWRNSLLQKRGNTVTKSMWVRSFPHHFVIDAQGVIRGRGLTHGETFALVDELLAEMKLAESGEGQAAADQGTLRGLVRFAGTKVPLDPLKVTAEQKAACTARGGTMDMADRSRLVSEGGGLANVVLSVHVAGQTAKGEGQRVRVEQINCRYEPHIIVAPQGAQLEITNGDSVLHGASARTLHNSSFNLVLPSGMVYSTDLKAVDRFELTSDTHPWMSSWVLVTDTPYIAISNTAGEFSLPNLPVGKYVANWWHESLGKGETTEFEIKPGGTALIELVLGAE